MRNLNHRAMVLAFVGLLSPILSLTAEADTVLKFDFGNTSTAGDFGFDGLSIATADDSQVLTVGMQDSNLSFNGFLDPMFSDISQGASLTISGIGVAGPPITEISGAIFQPTAGGSFSIFNPTNVLLLAGNFGSGLISGDIGSLTADFFNSSPVLFTGGTLFNLIEPNTGNFSLALNNVNSGGTDGLVISNNVLQPFTTDATGQIEAFPASVPEPTALPLILLVSTLVSMRRERVA